MNTPILINLVSDGDAATGKKTSQPRRRLPRSPAEQRGFLLARRGNDRSLRVGCSHLCCVHAVRVKNVFNLVHKDRRLNFSSEEAKVVVFIRRTSSSKGGSPRKIFHSNISEGCLFTVMGPSKRLYPFL
jgi:hypothetical protein